VPTILVIAVLGFGAPTLQLSLPTDVVSGSSRRLVYTAYVSEVYRAGSVGASVPEAAARSLVDRW
jgi:hypothetical protein